MRTFEEIAQGMSLDIRHPKAKLDYSGKFTLSVYFPNHENVCLNYCDYYLNTLSIEEIKALLSHEACHISTLADSRLPYDTEASDFVNWFNQTVCEIYDEWLAHKEFFRRFQQAKCFELYRSIKMGEFESYERILEQSRGALMPGVNAVYSILNDAIFFSVIGDTSFANWADKNDFSASIKLLDWLIEDFRYVESLKLDFESRSKKLRSICKFALGVDTEILVTANRIRFAEPPGNMRDDVKVEVDPKIEKNWAERMWRGLT